MSMSTPSVQATDQGVDQATGQASSQQLADMDAFLTMFTTQLQYQDPTNPMESYELASQLAQFSTVEMLSQINTSIVDQQAYLASINNAQMINLIGQDITALSDSLEVTDGQVTRGGYELEADANEVVVKIYDQNGNLVRIMSEGGREAGEYQLEWDGKSDSGDTVSDGTYRFEVEAVDASGNSVYVTTRVTGTVSAVRLDDGMTYLVLDGSDGVQIPINAIMSVTKTSDES